eukprot:TRINITY_DN67288_c0_g1_i1.p1 TRINITY_DN67288_c0_g1~~TRINITY_DN67288_c0_g1_i1.p1  ORF type:complete len:780 (-),score=217.54 TRINITY_DN67288_c0_g1_i1:63-2402(-)
MPLRSAMPAAEEAAFVIERPVATLGSACCGDHEADAACGAESDASTMSTAALSSMLEQLQHELEVEREEAAERQQALLQSAEAGQYLLEQNTELQGELDAALVELEKVQKVGEEQNRILMEQNSWLQGQCARMEDEADALRDQLRALALKRQACRENQKRAVVTLGRRAIGATTSSDEDSYEQAPVPARSGGKRAASRVDGSSKAASSELTEAQQHAQEAWEEVRVLEVENRRLRLSVDERRKSEMKLLAELHELQSEADHPTDSTASSPKRARPPSDDGDDFSDDQPQEVQGSQHDLLQRLQARVEHLEIALAASRAANESSKAEVGDLSQQLALADAQNQEMEEDLCSMQLLLEQERSKAEGLASQVQQLVTLVEEERAGQSAQRMMFLGHFTEASASSNLARQLAGDRLRTGPRLARANSLSPSSGSPNAVGSRLRRAGSAGPSVFGGSGDPEETDLDDSRSAAAARRGSSRGAAGEPPSSSSRPAQLVNDGGDDPLTAARGRPPGRSKSRSGRSQGKAEPLQTLEDFLEAASAAAAESSRRKRERATSRDAASLRARGGLHASSLSPAPSAHWAGHGRSRGFRECSAAAPPAAARGRPRLTWQGDQIVLKAPQAAYCPKGHELRPWAAERGTCDGCSKGVEDDELVMDCRECDYYLCDGCLPQHRPWRAGPEALLGGASAKLSSLGGSSSSVSRPKAQEQAAAAAEQDSEAEPAEAEQGHRASLVAGFLGWLGGAPEATDAPDASATEVIAQAAAPPAMSGSAAIGADALNDELL